MHRARVLAMLWSCCTAAAAQSIVIPAGLASVPGNETQFTYPWQTAFLQSQTPVIRSTTLYANASFTAQSVAAPVLIQRLRWRAASRPNGTPAWSGGQCAGTTIRLATAAVPYHAPASTLAATFGPDLTTVFAGSVTVLGGGVPANSVGPWIVDVPLTTPFLYDPAAGDLAVDVEINNLPPAWSGGQMCPLDADHGPTTQATTLFAPTLTAPVGTFTQEANVIEVTYAPSPGAAQADPRGSGCYDRAASFYQFSGLVSFPLSNLALSMVFDGVDSYRVGPGQTGLVQPSVNAAYVAIGDNVEQAVTLASPLPAVGGAVSSLWVCSNGLVSTGPGNGTPPVASVQALLAFNHTCWATWHDFNPLNGGAIRFEELGNLSYLTWDGVHDNYFAPPALLSTFQLQFDRSNGNVHMVWGAMNSVNYLVGYHVGGDPANDGYRDLASSLPATFEVGRRRVPLALGASSRPVLGTSIHLLTANVPGTSPLGALVFGLARFDPGLDLGAAGMPGCRQHVRLDSALLFPAAGGNGSMPLAFPNLPVYSGLAVYAQSAAISPGANALGVITSNGLTLILGTH